MFVCDSCGEKHEGKYNRVDFYEQAEIAKVEGVEIGITSRRIYEVKICNDCFIMTKKLLHIKQDVIDKIKL